MIFLILGSAGFLGSHLSSYLKAKEHEVLSFDVIDNDDEDLRIPNNNILLNLINKCDFVYFAAFDVGNYEYLKRNETNFKYISNNVLIIHNTFDLLKKTGKPFIFISSSMAVNANSTYGILKMLGEKYTKSLNGLIVRIWNLYGEELKSPKSHCITDFLYNACLNGQMIIKTNGAEQRQFLHIQDCCDGLFALTKNYTNINREEMLDLTSFQWISIRELVFKIKDLLKSNIDISWSEMDVRDNAIVEPSKYILQFWKAKIDLTNGLTDLILNKI